MPLILLFSGLLNFLNRAISIKPINVDNSTMVKLLLKVNRNKRWAYLYFFEIISFIGKRRRLKLNHLRI